MYKMMSLIILTGLCIGAFTINEARLPMNLEMHLTVYVTRFGSNEAEFVSHHPAVLTTIGKNWLEDQIGDSPSTQPANYISVSSSTSSPSAAWTQIPSEIAANGLTRAIATYASTGDGTWTETKEFTCTTTTVTDAQLSGLQYGTTGDNNLLASDIFTPTTLLVGDKLTLVWSSSVS